MLSRDEYLDKAVQRYLGEEEVEESPSGRIYVDLIGRIEELRKEHDPTSEVALLLGMFRDVVSKIRRGVPVDGVVNEIRELASSIRGE